MNRLDRIEELNEKAEAAKEQAEAANNRYNSFLGDLENERRKFKELIGIKDTPEKSKFSFKKLWLDLWGYSGGFMLPGTMLIPMGILFLAIGLMPALIALFFSVLCFIAAFIIMKTSK